MKEAAVEDAEVTGAAEFVAAHPFGHTVAVARPPPARLLDESCPPRDLTAEEKEEADAEASSSSSSGKAPMPEAPPEDPAPSPTRAAKKKKKKKKKKVIMPQSRLDALMKVEEWEPLPPMDEEWLKQLAARIPNGEQYFADRGFTVESYRELNDMSFVVKAQTDLAAEVQEQLQEKGYVEMEVTDDDEEEAPAAAGRGRRRFRPGVSKKPGGQIKKLN